MHELYVIITFLIFGLIAGWIAAAMTERRGMGVIGYMVLGIIGSVLGEIVFEIVGFRAIHLIGRLIVAVVGSIIVLWIVSLLTGKKK